VHHDDHMESSPRRRDPVLLSILGVIALLVIASLAVVLTRGEPATLDPTTPEGTVQAYTTALLDGDLDAARELVDESTLDDCAGSYAPDIDGDIRITLESSAVNGSTAVVRVTMHTSYDPGPFGGSGYSSDESFRLTAEGDGWRVLQAPWQFDVCTLEGVR
jgi:hypothetical protein